MSTLTLPLLSTTLTSMPFSPTFRACATISFRPVSSASLAALSRAVGPPEGVSHEGGTFVLVVSSRARSAKIYIRLVNTLTSALRLERA